MDASWVSFPPVLWFSCFPALATKCAGSRPGHAHPHNLLLLSLSSNLSRCTFSQMGGERKEEEENDYYGQEKLVQQKHFFSFPGAWQNVADVGEKCAYFSQHHASPHISQTTEENLNKFHVSIFFFVGESKVWTGSEFVDPLRVSEIMFAELRDVLLPNLSSVSFSSSSSSSFPLKVWDDSTKSPFLFLLYHQFLASKTSNWNSVEREAIKKEEGFFC